MTMLEEPGSLLSRVQFRKRCLMATLPDPRYLVIPTPPMNKEQPEIQVVSFRHKVEERKGMEGASGDAGAGDSSTDPKSSAPAPAPAESWHWTAPGLLPVERPLMCIAALFGAWVTTANGARGSVDESMGCVRQPQVAWQSRSCTRVQVARHARCSLPGSRVVA
jgi:hypothetical protein